jgi:hypothetical protein
VDVSPGDDVTHATVARMSDQMICAELARLDAKWHLPQKKPTLFDCDDSDIITAVPFADVPYDVLGAYPTGSNTKFADIRGVDHWLKSQDSRHERRTVPQFYTQDDLPYFRALTREWAGRLRFATEQHSGLEIFDLLTTVTKSIDGRDQDDRMETEQATIRILELVRQSESDRIIISDVAIAPLVSLLSHRWGKTRTFAAEALFWIAELGGYARIRQIAQAKAAEPLVAMVKSKINGHDIKWASLVLQELAIHPSTAILVVQADATLPLVEALNEPDQYGIGVFKVVAYTLANIILFDATQIRYMNTAGAMEPLVEALDASHLGPMKSVSAAAYLIAIIATVPPGRKAIRMAGGIGPLVALLAVDSTVEPNLYVNVTRALFRLAEDDSCQLAMISANTVDALKRVSQHGDPNVRKYARDALQRLGRRRAKSRTGRRR